MFFSDAKKCILCRVGYEITEEDKCIETADTKKKLEENVVNESKDKNSVKPNNLKNKSRSFIFFLMIGILLMTCIIIIIIGVRLIVNKKNTEKQAQTLVI